MINQDHVLTAEEGADRVRARRQHRRESDDDDPGYCCENCGHNEFHVIERFTVIGEYQNLLPCSCGEHENAATRTLRHWTPHETTYLLDDEHRFGEELDSEQVDDTEEEEMFFEIDCHECFEKDGTDEQAWRIEEDEPEIEDQEFSVCCAECDHEIEFGWSHENRGGRIWTVEDLDFNPWKSWPEPRFTEAWARRGWLRPLTRDASAGQ